MADLDPGLERRELLASELRVASTAAIPGFQIRLRYADHYSDINILAPVGGDS